MEIIKNSLADYVDSRIDVLKDKSLKEMKQTKGLINFFFSLKKDIENFTKGFQKSIDILSGTITVETEWREIIQISMRQYSQLVRALFDFGEDMEKNILKPLQSFIDVYDQTNASVFSSSKEIINEISNQKNLYNKAKIKYLKKKKELLNCNTEAAYKSKLPSFNNTEQEYKKLMEVVNNKIDSSKTTYNNLLRTWYESEESKSKLIKSILMKYFELSNDICNICISSNVCLKKTAENKDVNLDLEKYIPITFEKEDKLFSKLTYEIFTEENVYSKKLAKLFPKGLTSECFEMVKNKIKGVFEDEVVHKLEAEQILSIVTTTEGLKIVYKEFALINRKIELENEEAFEFLSELGLLMLNQISKHKFPQIKYLAAILNLGALVAYYGPKATKEKCKKYLRNKFMHDPIWKFKDIWIKVLQYKINKEVNKFKMYAQLRESNNTDNDKRPNKGVDISGITYTELAFVSIEMALYFVNPNLCRDIIIEFSKSSSMDSVKLYQLLVDYESAQPIPRADQPTTQEVLQHSLEKRNKERKRYSSSKGIMIIGMSLYFIPDLSTLITLLLVNRQFYSIFKPKVHRIALTMYREQVRFKLWRAILHSRGFESLYKKLKDTRLEGFIKNNPEIEEIIRMDVLRSFLVPSEKDQASIMDILRCYAITSPEIEYCQGMNCIAGMFYLIYKNEGIAFTMLSTLINEFSLSNLFKQDVPLLRIYFYQLNRLIAVFLPRLHLHFFEEGINAAHFASSWFLTVFTFVMQFSKSVEIPRLLLSIFDGFLTKGMSSLFRFSLFILKYYEEKFLGYKSEEILQILSALATNDFFNNPDVEKVYIQTIQDFNITNRLLDRLSKEHDEICVRSKEYKNVQLQSKEPFRHYIPSKGKFVAIYI